MTENTMTFEVIGNNVAEKKKQEMEKREAAVNTEREKILGAINQVAVANVQFNSGSVCVVARLDEKPYPENVDFLSSNGFKIRYSSTYGCYVAEGKISC